MSAATSPHQLARLAQIKALNTRTKTANSQRKARFKPDPKISPSQQIGLKHETRAAHYLADQGLHILQRNVQTRAGEIDIIATDAQYLIFVEVRYRTNNHFGGAIASINRAKQSRIIRSAQLLLPTLSTTYFHGNTPYYRFDVIAINQNHIHWITNAFGA